MARTALHGRLTWQTAAVTAVTRETSSVCTIGLDLPDWPGHRAGQHLDVRLTAEDGYTADREYSIASAPGEPLAITVERLEEAGGHGLPLHRVRRSAVRDRRGSRRTPTGSPAHPRRAMRDDPRTVVTDPHASYVGTELGERTLLPGADAILGEIRYSNWPGRTASGK